MNLFSQKKNNHNAGDPTLVLSSLGGDREAFCEIVRRYQNLLCSLAYSAVGDIKHSEDIAQETFVEAWKKLDTLNDPEKLKSWLCGILRFKVSRFRRKESTQATHAAIDLQNENFSEEPIQEKMDNVAIKEQEHALLWRALDKMDDNYREPLILFYREQRSIELVASELDLTVDTTKQRLSRGRKLLQKSMLKYVEDTLVKSKPGIGFTSAVLFAINTIAPPAKAAVIGATAIKTSSLFKFATLITFLATCSGFISTFFGLQSSLAQSKTERERKHSIKLVAQFLLYAVIFVVCLFLLTKMAIANNEYMSVYLVSSQLLVFAFVFSYIKLVIKMFKDMKQLRAEERIFHPESFQRSADKKDSKQRVYKSKLTLLGTPIFHFQFEKPEAKDKPAFAWIAGGNLAYGLLFAWGGVAIAPISVGIISVGVITTGAVGFGILSMGLVAIGYIGFGASTVAYKAYASMSALGWESAVSGGFSIANEAAIGSLAYANQVNNQQAAELSNLMTLNQHFLWVLIFIAFIVIVPAAWYSKAVRQRMK